MPGRSTRIESPEGTEPPRRGSAGAAIQRNRSPEHLVDQGVRSGLLELGPRRAGSKGRHHSRFCSAPRQPSDPAVSSMLIHVCHMFGRAILIYVLEPNQSDPEIGLQVSSHGNLWAEAGMNRNREPLVVAEQNASLEASGSIGSSLSSPNDSTAADISSRPLRSSVFTDARLAQLPSSAIEWRPREPTPGVRPERQ